MNKLIIASALSLAFSSAFADSDKSSPMRSTQIVSVDANNRNSASAEASSRSASSASSFAAGGNARATGGSAHAAGGAGGSSSVGNVSASTGAVTVGGTSSSATGGSVGNVTVGGTSSSSTGGNVGAVTVGGTSSAGGSVGAVTNGSATSGNSQTINISSPSETTVKNVPSMFSGALTSSNDTCMGSTTAGAAGPGFGVSFGTTWTDSNCKMLKNARELHNMGMRAAALTLLCRGDDSIREALEVTGYTCPGPVVYKTQATGR